MPRAARADTVRLKPADPFELIRWLARSQSDPRKAVAELVQNSFDAQAKEVRVTRRRLRGAPSLVVWDDGVGVIPEMERSEALRFLATHVGHSRKRNLTPSQRMEQVVAGQYGVGLLGFWAIGRRLELRTRVGGGDLMALELTEDEPQAKILRLPAPLGAPPTFTEVVVFGIHEAALRFLSGRRLADYLAAELRGQLLARSVALRVHDGVARGTAQKDFLVEPRRFLGERLALPAKVEVPGHAALSIELYAVAPGAPAGIQLYAAGSRVADDLAELEPFELREKPWSGCGLTGLVDYPDFSIPPGTRRGVLPDEAAAAFVEALRKLAPGILAQIEQRERDRDRVSARDVWRDLRRALKGFDARLPQYDLLTPESAPAAGSAPAEGTGSVPEASPPPAEGAPADDFEGAEAAPPELPQGELPLGPLASVRIEPERIEIAPGRARRLHGLALDAEGRRCGGRVDLVWSVEGASLAIAGEGARPALRAAADGRPGERGLVRLHASAGEVGADAQAEVEIVAALEKPGSRLGIPEPTLVSRPGEGWRSRMAGIRWEVNEAHEDYLAVRGEPKAHFRYLLALLAKEIVQRSYGQPGSDALLERLVEVLAHAERNLRGG
ncbi:MAG: ATP-binding protein [Myxococcales bacterium]